MPKDIDFDFNSYFTSNANAYLVKLTLNPEKDFKDKATGQILQAPYYGVDRVSNVVDLGGMQLIDTAKVFIPGAMSSTGTPTPGWWLPVGTDSKDLAPVIYRVVIAKSPTKHDFARELPNCGVLLNLEGISDTHLNRTWAEAQDSIPTNRM